VVAYIDQAINGIDPELVPLNFWDSIRDQMSACADQLNAFASSKNIGNLQNANQNVDSILGQIRPYMLGKGRLGPALQSAAKVYSATLTDAAKALREQSAEATKSLAEAQQSSSLLAEKAKKEAEELNRKYNDLLVSSEGHEASLDVLARHMEEINSFYRRLSVGGDGSPSIKEEIAVAREGAISGKDAIDKLDASAASTIKELTIFEARILGALDKDGKRSGGLAEELNSRMRELGDVEEQQKKRYVALNEKIESLIPGATSAGLATAYKQMKDSFAQPIRRANLVFYWTIAAIVLLSIIVSVDSVGLWWIKFDQMTDWASVGRSLAHKLPFYAPLVWLAYVASKRRSEFQRLEQEYAHKESLAKSYDSYKKQIDELGGGNDQLMRDLLAKAVDAIAFNASVSLDGRHGDKIPLQEALEKAMEKVAEIAIKKANAGPLGD
jgi:flagellar motility protein MotE (MotC chaperone)